MLIQRKDQKGFTAIIVAFLVLLVMFGIAASLIILSVGQTKIATTLAQSNRAYYVAEAGIEDILLRLNEGMQYSSPYSFSLEGVTVEVTVSDLSGASKTITAEGNSNNRIRKVEVVYELSGSNPGFFYGAQVGDGGLLMKNRSKVIGNVFSNGNAKLEGPESEITNTISVANVGNKIFGEGKVSENVFADRCEDIRVTGVLHANNVSGCAYGSLTNSGLPVNPISLPIPDSQIQEWKDDAEVGGIIGSFTRNSGISYLGPVKIEGNLTIQNTAKLVITGTILVTGTINMKNSAQVSLDSSYGSSSGIIIGESIITLENSSTSSGSGSPGSYLMYISTSSANPAIIIKNFARVDILYSNSGWVEINNNTSMKSIYAYGITVQNEATLKYEIGLANAFFVSGPSAGWVVKSWREVL